MRLFKSLYAIKVQPSLQIIIINKKMQPSKNKQNKKEKTKFVVPSLPEANHAANQADFETQTYKESSFQLETFDSRIVIGQKVEGKQSRGIQSYTPMDVEESIQKLRESASHQMIELSSPLVRHNEDQTRNMKSNRRLLDHKDTLEQNYGNDFRESQVEQEAVSKILDGKNSSQMLDQEDLKLVKQHSQISKEKEIVEQDQLKVVKSIEILALSRHSRSPQRLNEEENENPVDDLPQEQETKIQDKLQLVSRNRYKTSSKSPKNDSKNNSPVRKAKDAQIGGIRFNQENSPVIIRAYNQSGEIQKVVRSPHQVSLTLKQELVSDQRSILVDENATVDQSTEIKKRLLRIGNEGSEFETGYQQAILSKQPSKDKISTQQFIIRNSAQVPFEELRYQTSQTLGKDLDQLTFNGTVKSNENMDNNFKSMDGGHPTSGQVSITRLKEGKNEKGISKKAVKASDLDYIFVNNVPQTQDSQQTVSVFNTSLFKNHNQKGSPFRMSNSNSFGHLNLGLKPEIAQREIFEKVVEEFEYKFDKKLKQMTPYEQSVIDKSFKRACWNEQKQAKEDFFSSESVGKDLSLIFNVKDVNQPKPTRAAKIAKRQFQTVQTGAVSPLKITGSLLKNPAQLLQQIANLKQQQKEKVQAFARLNKDLVIASNAANYLSDETIIRQNLTQVKQEKERLQIEKLQVLKKAVPTVKLDGLRSEIDSKDEMIVQNKATLHPRMFVMEDNEEEQNKEQEISQQFEKTDDQTPKAWQESTKMVKQEDASPAFKSADKGTASPHSGNQLSSSKNNTLVRRSSLNDTVSHNRFQQPSQMTFEAPSRLQPRHESSLLVDESRENKPFGIQINPNRNLTRKMLNKNHSANSDEMLHGSLINSIPSTVERSGQEIPDETLAGQIEIMNQSNNQRYKAGDEIKVEQWGGNSEDQTVMNATFESLHAISLTKQHRSKIQLGEGGTQIANATFIQNSTISSYQGMLMQPKQKIDQNSFQIARQDSDEPQRLDLTIQSKSIKKKEDGEEKLNSTAKKRIYEPIQSQAMMDIVMRRPVIERYYQEDAQKNGEGVIKEGSLSKAILENEQSQKSFEMVGKPLLSPIESVIHSGNTSSQSKKAPLVPNYKHKGSNKFKKFEQERQNMNKDIAVVERNFPRKIKVMPKSSMKINDVNSEMTLPFETESKICASPELEIKGEDMNVAITNIQITDHIRGLNHRESNHKQPKYFSPQKSLKLQQKVNKQPSQSPLKKQYLMQSSQEMRVIPSQSSAPRTPASTLEKRKNGGEETFDQILGLIKDNNQMHQQALRTIVSNTNVLQVSDQQESVYTEEKSRMQIMSRKSSQSPLENYESLFKERQKQLESTDQDLQSKSNLKIGLKVSGYEPRKKPSLMEAKSDVLSQIIENEVPERVESIFAKKQTHDPLTSRVQKTPTPGGGVLIQKPIQIIRRNQQLHRRGQSMGIMSRKHQPAKINLRPLDRLLTENQLADFEEMTRKLISEQEEFENSQMIQNQPLTHSKKNFSQISKISSSAISAAVRQQNTNNSTLVLPLSMANSEVLTPLKGLKVGSKFQTDNQVSLEATFANLNQSRDSDSRSKTIINTTTLAANQTPRSTSLLANIGAQILSPTSQIVPNASFIFAQPASNLIQENYNSSQNVHNAQQPQQSQMPQVANKQTYQHKNRFQTPKKPKQQQTPLNNDIGKHLGLNKIETQFQMLNEASSKLLPLSSAKRKKQITTASSQASKAANIILSGVSHPINKVNRVAQPSLQKAKLRKLVQQKDSGVQANFASITGSLSQLKLEQERATRSNNLSTNSREEDLDREVEHDQESNLAETAALPNLTRNVSQSYQKSQINGEKSGGNQSEMRIQSHMSTENSQQNLIMFSKQKQVNSGEFNLDNATTKLGKNLKSQKRHVSGQQLLKESLRSSTEKSTNKIFIFNDVENLKESFEKSKSKVQPIFKS